MFAIVLTLAALAAPSALANYVYWPNIGGTTIGRVAIDGTQLNNNFIQAGNNPANDAPAAVALDSHYIYWVHGGLTNGAIGRAKLDGTDVNPSFIPHSAGVSDPFGITVTATHIYWANEGPGTIGRADISGANPNPALISDPGNSPCGLTNDNKFLYYTAYPGGNANVARVPIGGGTPDDNFIVVPGGKDDCGVAVDTSHIYFNGSTSSVIERANIDGTNVDPNFISGVVASGIAVTPQYVFWGGAFSDPAVGRAAIDGSGTNQAFAIPGGTGASPYLLAASPSNSFTVGKPKLNKNGTAKLTVTVSGPGALVADAASKGAQAVASKKKKSSTVKRVQKTAGGASTLRLKIRASGKALKALKKKGKAKVKVGITFTPQGVAGVPALTTQKLVLKRR